MSLMDSKAVLSRAAKELLQRWQECKETWTDVQAKEFEKSFLEPMEQDLRSAMTALEQMNNVIMNLEKDCE